MSTIYKDEAIREMASRVTRSIMESYTIDDGGLRGRTFKGCLDTDIAREEERMVASQDFPKVRYNAERNQMLMKVDENFINPEPIPDARYFIYGRE